MFALIAWVRVICEQRSIYLCYYIICLMKVKYQIFVSSTFDDLKAERELVIKAILEMGHIPVGMEMFSAGDEEQWKLIQRQIDDCDYYVVIVAHRYGSMDGTISYTEKEYDYALRRNLPCLGFVILDHAEWPANKFESDIDKKVRLDDFKNKVKKKIVSWWSNKDDLYGKVGIALMKQFTTAPGIGWVKANELVGPEVISELSRLSKENSDLRSRIAELHLSNKSEEDAKFDKLKDILLNHKVKLSFFYRQGLKWENEKEFSLLRIFKLLAPELMVEKSTKATGYHLGFMLNPDKDREVRNEFPVPDNRTKIILSDFTALDLVRPSNKKHTVHDSNQYWTITEEGKELFKRIRRQIIESNRLNEVASEMKEAEDKSPGKGKDPKKKRAKSLSGSV